MTIYIHFTLSLSVTHIDADNTCQTALQKQGLLKVHFREIRLQNSIS